MAIVNLPTYQIRHSRDRLTDDIEAFKMTAQILPHLSMQERKTVIKRQLNFLDTQVIVHIKAEELSIYPAWQKLTDNQLAANILLFDHQEIIERIEIIRNTPIQAVAYLQELFYSLHNLIMIHLQKEEKFLLPDLDKLSRTDNVFIKFTNKTHSAYAS